MSEFSQPLRHNPFPSSAVAVIDLDNADPLTITTAPITEALTSLTAYLRPEPGERGSGEPASGSRAASWSRGATARASGSVLAVIGDYGTGKTHLVVRLLREARRVSDAGGMVVHLAYLDAAGGTFHELYRRFTDRMTQAELLETVRDYYADVVAKALERSEVTQETARRLRDRELDPASVVDGLGLTDSVLLRELREDLVQVTDNPQFGTALALLLRRPEYADDVWAWLTGGPPSPALRERGVTAVINGDDMSLEAMGVFAYLYGRRNHRFVLVIDELQKLLAVPLRPDQIPPADAFRKLVDVFLAAGAFLAVVGLPDLFENLGEGVRQRFSHIVNTTPLDGGAVAALIEAAHAQEYGQAQLAPFDASAPELISKLANGTFRQVIRLCHRSYRISIQERRSRIDDAVVHRAAHTTVEFPDLPSVREELRRRIKARGLAYREQEWLPGPASRAVDFWVTPGNRPAGCAVIVSSSVVTGQDAAPLLSLAQVVRSQAEQAQSILVVVGYLHRDMHRELARVLSFEPVVYGRAAFEEEFAATLDGAVQRIEAAEGADASTRMLDRLVWIHDQQANAQDQLTQLADRMDGLQAFVAQQTDAVRRVSMPIRQAPPEPLPPRVHAVFADAFGLLEQLDAVRAGMRGAVSLQPTSEARSPDRQRLLQQLDALDIYPVVGLISLLRQLVEALHTGVTQWFAEQDGQPAAPETDSLNALCNAYEVVYDHLQVVRLDEQAVGVAGVGVAGHREAISQRLGELGKRVLQTALTSISAAPGPAGRDRAAD